MTNPRNDTFKQYVDRIAHPEPMTPEQRAAEFGKNGAAIFSDLITGFAREPYKFGFNRKHAAHPRLQSALRMLFDTWVGSDFIEGWPRPTEEQREKIEAAKRTLEKQFNNLEIFDVTRDAKAIAAYVQRISDYMENRIVQASTIQSEYTHRI